MSHPVISPKKLIEVALPLDAINEASAKEKAIRQGHPSSLHLWWARRPLAAARAVIFSQLVNDPEDLWRCQNPGADPNKQVKGHWTKSRAKLFSIIEDLVKWENSTNKTVLEKARAEIQKSWRETCELNKDHPQVKDLFDPKQMPGLHDPFAGGGAIPLESQRLGLTAYASDLNPVAVLINKAMIEIPPRFADQPAVNPNWRRKCAEEKAGKVWQGATGLASDVRFYGEWMRDEAIKRIGGFYPLIQVSREMARERPDLEPYVGESLTCIAWLWARTVRSPNPAYANAEVPLVSSFILSSKAGKEVYVEPIVYKDDYSFVVRVGKPPNDARSGTKSARGANFRCVMSGVPIDPLHIKKEAIDGRMGQRLMAIVAEGSRGRVYLSPTIEHISIAGRANPGDAVQSIQLPIANDPRPMTCLLYGMTRFDQLFTQRQLLTLTTFSDLIASVRERVRDDALASGLHDGEGIEQRGCGAKAYSEAVCLYLSFVIDKMADLGNSLCNWEPIAQCPRHLFGRQAIPIIWDFAEANPFSDSSGGWSTFLDGFAKAFANAFGSDATCTEGFVSQADAQATTLSQLRFVSTDPPYYDNIGYADLADFFYVWLRRSLRNIFPQLLATISVPKSEELVAVTYRHESKGAAEAFFLKGMTHAMQNVAVRSHPAAPVTIYYAFKQSESDAAEGTSSSGWDTFLEAVIRAGLLITGTWPIRTENKSRMRGMESNALASSIVLVCRARTANVGAISRRQFVRMLNEVLPTALDSMTRESEGLHSPVAPVDLSQAIIGPGMAIFSRYEAVLEADGTPMTVKTALQLINRFLAEDDFDADTQFCLRWFEQHGWEASAFGEADVLARAKGTSVEGVKHAGVVTSAGGSVRLLPWKELAPDWDPTRDTRVPIWQVLHQMMLAYSTQGDIAAGRLYAATLGKTEAARQLAYRLYTLCERRSWAEEARAYNEVVTGWSGIESAAAQVPKADVQGTLFSTEERV